MTKTYRAIADPENNAETWWLAVRAQEPELARRLEAGTPITVSEAELRRLEALPGWADGPSYARKALVVTEDHHA